MKTRTSTQVEYEPTPKNQNNLPIVTSPLENQEKRIGQFLEKVKVRLGTTTTLLVAWEQDILPTVLIPLLSKLDQEESRMRAANCLAELWIVVLKSELVGDVETEEKLYQLLQEILGEKIYVQEYLVDYALKIEEKNDLDMRIQEVWEKAGKALNEAYSSLHQQAEKSDADFLKQQEELLKKIKETKEKILRLHEKGANSLERGGALLQNQQEVTEDMSHLAARGVEQEKKHQNNLSQAENVLRKGAKYHAI